jgi:hypothetical protein
MFHNIGEQYSNKNTDTLEKNTSNTNQAELLEASNGLTTGWTIEIVRNYINEYS